MTQLLDGRLSFVLVSVLVLAFALSLLQVMNWRLLKYSASKRVVLILLGFGLLLHVAMAALVVLLEAPSGMPMTPGLWSTFFLPLFTVLSITYAVATVLVGQSLKGSALSRDADLALIQSDARLLSLLRDIPNVAVRSYGRDGLINYWNRGATELYGYTAQQAIGSRITDLIVPAERRYTALRAIERMFENQRGNPAREIRFLNHEARELTVYCSNAYLSRAGHGPEIISFDIDMSALSQTQAELRIAALAFESSESMVVLDAQLRILRVNQTFCARFGYSSGEVVGLKLAQLSAETLDSVAHEELNRLLFLQGKWSGEVWLCHHNGGLFPEWLDINAVANTDDEVTHYVASLTSLSQRKMEEEKIRQLAYFDPLTQLPNRSLLLDRLRQALRLSRASHYWGAVLLIDLDRFKTLNDTQGHRKGDLLLQLAAKRVAQLLKPADTVARMGGDEFVVLLQNLDFNAQQALDQAQQVGQRIKESLSHNFGLEDTHFHLSCSIGISLFQGDESSTDELIKQADLAMYHVKANGRNGLQVFDQSMQASMTARTELAAQIRLALAQQQFEVHYQPQVNSMGQVVGAEALLRWLHPQRGEIAPGYFIPVAEETGQIVALGDWVLRSVCEQLQRWSGNPLLASLTLSANVSTQQFGEPGFVDKLLRLLEVTGADPKYLKLELTESVMVDNLEDIAQKMQRLKNCGISFALDDFGTGYSSLAYLKKLPIDELKIDKSFVQHILTNSNDAAIARTIVTLSHSLGLEVVAEGVETEKQREMLAWYRCFTYQGYLFSRPLPASAFEQYVAGMVSA